MTKPNTFVDPKETQRQYLLKRAEYASLIDEIRALNAKAKQDPANAHEYRSLKAPLKAKETPLKRAIAKLRDCEYRRGFERRVFKRIARAASAYQDTVNAAMGAMEDELTVIGLAKHAELKADGGVDHKTIKLQHAVKRAQILEKFAVAMDATEEEDAALLAALEEMDAFEPGWGD